MMQLLTEISAHFAENFGVEMVFIVFLHCDKGASPLYPASKADPGKGA